MNDYSILAIDNIIFDKDLRPKVNGIELNSNESLIDQNILPQTFIYLSAEPSNIAVYFTCTANSRNYYSLAVLKTCHLLTTSIYTFIHWTMPLVMIIVFFEVNIDLKDKFIECVKLLVQQNGLILGKEICEKLLNNENIPCNIVYQCERIMILWRIHHGHCENSVQFCDI